MNQIQKLEWTVSDLSLRIYYTTTHYIREAVCHDEPEYFLTYDNNIKSPISTEWKYIILIILHESISHANNKIRTTPLSWPALFYAA